MGFLTRQAARQDAYYFRNRAWAIKGSGSAANRRTIVSPSHMVINIGGVPIAGHSYAYELEAAVELDLDLAASWDTIVDTNYTIPINRAGKDIYIYECQPVSGHIPVILISALATFPSGYNATNSRKVGGFHCLPYVTAPTWTANTTITLNYVVQPTVPNATSRFLYRCTARAGDFKTDPATEPTWPTTPGATVVDDMITWTCDANGCENLAGDHPYLGYLMGDIIFNSIWDLPDRPRPSPGGMVKGSLTPSDGLPARWGDIYLASGVGTACTSVFGATIKDTVDWNSFVHYGRLQKKRLMRDAEFQEFAFGSNEETNIAGSDDPGTCTFPLDTAGKSMISQFGNIAMCGVAYQWLDEQSYRFDPDASVAAASKTYTITHAAAPVGNQVYVKMLANGRQYLCANNAVSGLDRWITIGTDYKLLISHDAAAAVGGVPVYFDEDATQPSRLLAVLTRAKNGTIEVSPNVLYEVQVTHNANAATLGVAVYCNDTAGRLEFISPTTVNGTLDMALLGGVAWALYNLPGTVGSLYRQGAYGDVKLRAGGHWGEASYCGSRCRSADGWRWAASSSIGGRFCAEPA